MTDRSDAGADLALKKIMDSIVSSNQALIQVLRNALQREYDKIDRAEQEIIKLKLELLELGVELPLGE